MAKRRKRLTKRPKNETAVKVVSEFSMIQRENYRRKEALEGRIPKEDTANALNITKQTIANWEPYVIAAIPDYANHYQMRRGFTRYQIWVWLNIVPRFLNRKGRKKLTFEELPVELQNVSAQYSYQKFREEQENAVRRSCKTA